MITSTVNSQPCQYTIEQDHATGKKFVSTRYLGDCSKIDTVRSLMKCSFDAGYEGRLHSSASKSSCVFHLRMGMMPRESLISVLPHQFGLSGTHALRNFNQICAAHKSSNEETSGSIQLLKTMLVYARTGKYDEESAKKLSDDELFQGKKDLLAFQNATYSYMQNQFIPQLLLDLKAIPQTSDSEEGCCDMQMSQDGQKRWKEDIEGKQPFMPFEKFEHLNSYMTAQQRQELDAILATQKP